jgi:hypothetical protein
MRSERALTIALAEMYVQGVSTRKVKAITEQLCDTHDLSHASEAGKYGMRQSYWLQGSLLREKGKGVGASVSSVTRNVT